MAIAGLSTGKTQTTEKFYWKLMSFRKISSALSTEMPPGPRRSASRGGPDRSSGPLGQGVGPTASRHCGPEALCRGDGPHGIAVPRRPAPCVQIRQHCLAYRYAPCCSTRTTPSASIGLSTMARLLTPSCSTSVAIAAPTRRIARRRAAPRPPCSARPRCVG